MHYLLPETSASMDSGMRDKIIELAKSMGAYYVGFASPELWDSVDMVSRIRPECRPASILQGCKTVVVIGVPIPYAVLATAPSIAYNQLYNTTNSLLDQITLRLSLELMCQDYEAMPLPRDGYHGIQGLKDMPFAFFSHRHAAYLAGMGTFGVNNVLLTKEHGPRVRWTSLLTTADLGSSKPMEEEICIHCNRCVKACPVNALTKGNYPDNLTDKNPCILRSEELAKKKISPCGLCISSCPVGLKKDAARPTDESIEEIRKYIVTK